MGGVYVYVKNKHFEVIIIKRLKNCIVVSLHDEDDFMYMFDKQ